MNSPTECHYTVAKQLLWYLKYTIHYGLHLWCSQPLSLHASSNVDWVGNHHDRASTTAYLVYLIGNAISWSYRKQKTMAHSSIELEQSCCPLAAEFAWISSLLRQLGVHHSSPTIYCDNMNATYLCVKSYFLLPCETYCYQLSLCKG